MKRLILVITSIVCLFAALGVVEAKQEPYVEPPGEDWGTIDNPFALPDDLSAFILFGRMDTFGDVDAFAQIVVSDAVFAEGFDEDLQVSHAGDLHIG